jgi:hypothetical protein
MIIARELMDAASSATGLDNFGDDHFREGLDRLLAAAYSDLKMSEAGEAAFRARNLSYLISRLEVEHWYDAHPEIDDQEVPSPLFGVGLPRTGSSFLHNLMSVEPAARFLRTWEAEKPWPPPTTETQDTDPRIAEIEAAAGGYAEIKRLAPEILAMVPMETVKDPAECHDLLGLSFRGQGFLNTILFSYLEWLRASDMVPAYQYHKRVLKLLQWRCPPNRWRLKAPEHSDALLALFTVYPDARFVVTHRDPTAIIPSITVLLHAINARYVDGLNETWVGAQTVRRWRGAADALQAFRAAKPEVPMFDVGFNRLQAEPLAVVQEIYEWLGEPITAAYEARMAAWRAGHPRNKHGAVMIELERYGLSEPDIAKIFADYRTRYQTYIA